MDNERIEIRDAREHYARIGFSFIDDPKIKDSKTIALYVALGRYADFITGGCWPKRRTIMTAARIGNNRTFYRCVESLERAGWLERQRSDKHQNAPTVYILTLPKIPVYPLFNNSHPDYRKI